MSKYPGIFQPGGVLTIFLEAYPYFLPCFAGAFLSAIMLIISFFFMEETCAKIKIDQEKSSSTKLLLQTPRSYSTFNNIKRQSINLIPHLPKKQSLASIFSLRECLIPEVTNILMIHIFLVSQLAYLGGMHCNKRCMKVCQLTHFT